MWYVYLKPALMLILSAATLGLSIIIIYAEIANFFGTKNNIIYNIINAPELEKENSYFLSHVN